MTLVSSRANARDPLRLHETRSVGRGFLAVFAARNDTRYRGTTTRNLSPANPNDTGVLVSGSPSA